MYRSLKRTCGRQRIATLVQAGILEKAYELRMAENRLQILTKFDTSNNTRHVAVMQQYCVC